MIFRSFVTFIPRDFAVDFSTKDIFCSLKWDLPRWDQNYPAKSRQFCPTLGDPMTVACKAPLSMGFCRQEYQSGLPFPSPGDLADPRIKPMSLISPALASGFFTTSAPWEAHKMGLRGIHLPNSALIHVVQFSSVTQLCPTLCNPMDCSIPGFPVHHQPLELAQTHVYSKSVMPSNHLILCHPFLLLPSIFPSIRVFSKESVLHIRWPKYWSSASTSVLPINIQDWFCLGLTGLISLQYKGFSSIFSNTTVQKQQFFSTQLSL